jgi:hypothetical protein
VQTVSLTPSAALDAYWPALQTEPVEQIASEVAVPTVEIYSAAPQVDSVVQARSDMVYPPASIVGAVLSYSVAEHCVIAVHDEFADELAPPKICSAPHTVAAVQALSVVAVPFSSKYSVGPQDVVLVVQTKLVVEVAGVEIYSPELHIVTAVHTRACVKLGDWVS